MLGDAIGAMLPELRAHAESMMAETVTVTRIGGLADDVNGREVHTVTLVYTGPAGLGKAGLQDQAAGAPGQQATKQAQVLKFPVGSYVPQDGDLVTFMEGVLTGVKMRLVGSSPASSFPTQYRMAAERII